MHAELVQKRRWISEGRFLHALNYCMVLPGPEAQQLATYLGWLMHRTWGGVAAGALFVLPSLMILLGLSWAYMRWGHTVWLGAVLYGVKPAVVALVALAAWRLGAKTLKNVWLATVALGAFGAMAWGQVPFAAVLLAAAALGVWAHRTAQPALLHGVPGAAPVASHAPASAAASSGAAIIDDTTPTPAHAQPNRRRLAQVLAAAVVLWSVPMAALWAVFGSSGTLTQMGGFFTQAALMTFGGAYAVLPFVVQGAVVQHGWLSAGQMMDGLALGESTPGPLIMVVAFVAFVGGWSSPQLLALWGPENRVWAASLAAIVVTWFTFLPSFIFILAGGPWVEATRGRLGWQVPLTYISAAVVGVIAQLALFFAAHVLWPEAQAKAVAGTAIADLAAQVWRGLDTTALLLAVAAAVALTRAGLGVITVIGLCAGAGLVIKGLAAAWV